MCGQVKRVRLPPLEYAATSTLPGPEQVEDMTDAGFTASAPRGATAQPPGGGTAQRQGQGHGEDELDFCDDVAYIYMMTK